MTIKTYLKGPAEELDYTADYTKELYPLGDRIASSLWVVAASQADVSMNTKVRFDDTVDIAADLDSETPVHVYSQGGTIIMPDLVRTAIMLDGGTVDRSYEIENRVVTQQGRKYTRRMIIKIKPR